MADPYVDIALAGANLLTGRSAAKAQKENLRRQAQAIQLQNQAFRQTMPTYQAAVRQYAGRAGLGTDGVYQTGENSFRLGQMPGQENFGLGGNWGDREDQLRLRAAEEDINRRMRQQENQLGFRLGQRGINEGALAATLGRNRAGAQSEFGQFRRGLAIDAGREQERRLAALMAALAPGMGQGAQAIAGLGQQAAQYGRQAEQAFGNLGSQVRDWQMRQMLGQLGQAPSPAPVGYPGPTSPAPWAPQPNPNWYERPDWWNAIE